MSHAIPVRAVVVHSMEQIAHLDEAVAIAILRMFGEERYPGIKDAPIVTFDPSVHGKLDDLERGYLLLGVGGSSLDDHPHSDFRDHCSTTLVVKDLGLEGNELLGNLARLVLASDRGGSFHVWHAEAVIKRLAKVATMEDILEIVSCYLDAYLATGNNGCSKPAYSFDELATISLVSQFGDGKMLNGTAIKDVEFSGDWIEAAREGRLVFTDRSAQGYEGPARFAAALKEIGLSQKREFSVLLQNLPTCAEKSPPHPLHIAAMVETMLSANVEWQTVFAFVDRWMAAEYADQKEFVEALDIVHDTGETIHVRNKSGRMFCLVYCESDNNSVGRAARTPVKYGGAGATLVVIRRKQSGGNWFISPNHREIQKPLDGEQGPMDLLAERIRTAEIKARGLPNSYARDVLRSDGILTGDVWYFQQGTGFLMNGCLTHEYVEPSRLSKEQIVGLCCDFLKWVKVPSLQHNGASRNRR